MRKALRRRVQSLNDSKVDTFKDVVCGSSYIRSSFLANQWLLYFESPNVPQNLDWHEKHNRPNYACLVCVRGIS
jgi:hypothetical protein